MPMTDSMSLIPWVECMRNMSSGQRDAASDFDLSAGHTTGITYANDKFYVVDRSRGKVYVFNP